ncbi:uncharacterized protein LOC111694520 [Trichogramma pretiosum]|uniref:uncharacterized protein LOC111694520 n=1 Tax=Trichogramma pretiosum TaxID=7493 RepID=UPI000C71C401|nr:uncharacterized protein LOC111694520 [Trichogramma pretiosum]
MGIKLKQISNLSQTEDFLKKDDEVFKHVSQLVQLHQYCIHCFDLLNTVTSCILVPAIFTVIVGLSITSYLMVIEYKEDINIALKMGTMYILCVEALLTASYPSQKIYDASSDIFEDW